MTPDVRFLPEHPGVAIAAARAYATADSAHHIAPHNTLVQAEDILLKANELESYKAFKTLNWVP